MSDEESPPDLIDPDTDTDNSGTDDEAGAFPSFNKKPGKKAKKDKKAKGEEKDKNAARNRAKVEKERAEKLKQDGNKLFLAAQYTQALELYNQAVTLDKENAKLYSNRAACYEKMQNWQHCLDDAQKCIQYDPSWPRGYLRKGKALEGLGKLVAALDACVEGKTVAKKQKGNVEEFSDIIASLYLQLGVEQKRKGKYLEAIQNFTKGLEQNTGNRPTPFADQLSKERQDVQALENAYKRVAQPLPAAAVAQVMFDQSSPLMDMPLQQSELMALQIVAGPAAAYFASKPREARQFMLFYQQQQPFTAAAASPPAAARLAPVLPPKDNTADQQLAREQLERLAQNIQAAAAPPPFDPKEQYLIDALELSNEAEKDQSEGRMIEALDKHERACELREMAQGEGRTLATRNLHELGAIWLYLNSPDKAFVHLEKAYKIRKKKKVSESERWTTGLLLAQIHKGSLRYKDAIEIFAKCERHFKEHHGADHEMCIMAAEQKKQTELLQAHAWRLVRVCKLEGEEARFNTQLGRLYAKLKLIVMLTGDVIVPATRQNYGYVEEDGMENQPPVELMPDVPPPEKLAAAGGPPEAPQDEKEFDEYSAIREMKRKHHQAGAKVLFAEFQKQYPSVQMSLSRLRKVLKDLEAEQAQAEMEKEKENAAAGSANGSANGANGQNSDGNDAMMRMKTDLHLALECPVCMEVYALVPRRVPHIIPSCGHTVCATCLEAQVKSQWQCGTCRSEIPKNSVFNRNFALANVLGVVDGEGADGIA
mmetsp:Transcript_3216/g.8052  ORF Transcript_3216/g.8052 Transcript_3216/m.8052 type:complete len:765 (+) Transcript_3216:141-2435(+)